MYKYMVANLLWPLFPFSYDYLWILHHLSLSNYTHLIIHNMYKYMIANQWHNQTILDARA